ncbi:MAG: hypothetical protein LBC75_03275 [Fibromonadaceae bacterium]|jgi:hypothetical protein|nr:hypothetical protein [Fibromonadaceae bacterium]
MRIITKIILAIGVLCLFAFAQTKPKAAVYIMGNPEGRDALRMLVNNFLIKSQKYQMIAVDAIDVVEKEQKRQNSGSVSDGDIALLGKDAGAEYVCVVERTELDGISYVATRMVSVQSKVAELADVTELPYGGKVLDIIEWQIGSMLGMPVGPRPKTTATSQPAPAQPVYTAPTQTQQPVSSMQGTIVPGKTLSEKLAWLQKSADSHNTYILEVSADESISPYTFEYKGAINITIVLRGVGGNRAIRLKSHGSMFTVNKNITFILDNNITLQGHSGNNGAMVRVYGGTFKMIGGTISGNTYARSGWIVCGGGIEMYAGTFEMTGGTISNNNADNGGGVCVDNSTTFTMIGGTIFGNNASKRGGGVYVKQGTFILRGGTIIGNTACGNGGGVSIDNYGGTFSKTGGTITGYKSDPSNGNVVNEDGDILARKGHAIYFSENKRRETTAGPSDNFSKDGSGAWDDAVTPAGSAPVKKGRKI